LENVLGRTREVDGESGNAELALARAMENVVPTA
jgi:hypothetical protein